MVEDGKEYSGYVVSSKPLGLMKRYRTPVRGLAKQASLRCEEEYSTVVNVQLFSDGE